MSSTVPVRAMVALAFFLLARPAHALPGMSGEVASVFAGSILGVFLLVMAALVIQDVVRRLRYRKLTARR